MANCGKCGSKLSEGAVYCNVCGAPVQSASSTSGNSTVVTGGNITLLLTFSGICAALLVVVIVLAFVMSGGLSYNYSYSAEKYVRADECGDVKTMLFYNIVDEKQLVEDIFSENGYETAEAFKVLEERFAELGVDREISSYDNLYDSMLEYGKLEPEYINADFSVTNSEELNGEPLDAAVQEFSEALTSQSIDVSKYVDIEDISEGYKVEVTVTGEEDGAEFTESRTLTIVKYKGSWRVLNYELDFYNMMIDAVGA